MLALVCIFMRFRLHTSPISTRPSPGYMGIYGSLACLPACNEERCRTTSDGVLSAFYQECQVHKYIEGLRINLAGIAPPDPPSATFDDSKTFVYTIVYSFFNEMPPLDLAAFFSFCSSFFCLFDLGGAFCTFFCSLFATIHTLLERRC